MGMTNIEQPAPVALRGFATVTYWAEDVAAARDWYAGILRAEAYFARSGPDGRPVYVEFRLGDRRAELGIADRRFAPPSGAAGPGGAIMYWHVDDLEGTYERLLANGATTYQPPIERGEGFVTAAVVDPFGNILGVMYNAHYLEMLHG